MPFLRSIAAWLFARLREPSTYAGIAGVVASLTFWPDAGVVAGMIPSIGNGVIALLGVVAILLPERK